MADVETFNSYPGGLSTLEPVGSAVIIRESLAEFPTARRVRKGHSGSC